MRKFERVSDKEWNKTIGTACTTIYNSILPKRNTKKSAGYDIYSPIDVTVPSHGMVKIPTGIKVMMEDDEILSIYPRSSIGFKTGIRLANTVGIVDADYYGNPDNEGHIFIKLYNPTDTAYEIKTGDKIAQGIFTKYLIVDDEEEIKTERSGGLGSTGK